MSRMYLGLGSNLGERLENLRGAVQKLPPTLRVVRKSSVFETTPVGPVAQPNFLNAVLEVETDLSPGDAFSMLKNIEADMGRTSTVRFGPRNIDIDVLLYDEVVMDTPTLTIPHPRMCSRLFVLTPLAEIAPRLVHPVFHKTVAELLGELVDETQLVRKVDESL